MDKKLGALLGVFFLSVTLFITVVFFNKPIAKFTRAKEDFLPSSAKSLILAFPLTVKADGVAESTINVFIRSDKGIPIKEQSIAISTSLGDVKEPTSATDDQGKATFHLSSSTPGIAAIEATIGGSVTLTQKLSVKFE